MTATWDGPGQCTPDFLGLGLETGALNNTVVSRGCGLLCLARQQNTYAYTGDATKLYGANDACIPYYVDYIKDRRIGMIDARCSAPLTGYTPRSDKCPQASLGTPPQQS